MPETIVSPARPCVQDRGTRRASNPEPDLLDLEDITRFNEAIDQSLARAVVSYNASVERTRQMFLAVLGHDLRNPINAISLAGTVLQRTLRNDPTGTELARTIVSSAGHMNQMVMSLLDFACSNLGGHLPVELKEHTKLDEIADGVVQELRTAHPNATIELHRTGDLQGTWEPVRMRQLLSNLLGNAIQHGDVDRPIARRLEGKGDAVEIRVINQGKPIPAQLIDRIFDRMTHGDEDRTRVRRPGSLGLGLYIARAITQAHGGMIEVESDEADGTRFTASIPRTPPQRGKRR